MQSLDNSCTNNHILYQVRLQICILKAKGKKKNQLLITMYIGYFIDQLFVLLCFVFPVGKAQNQEKGFLLTYFFTSSSEIILCNFFHICAVSRKHEWGMNAVFLLFC